MLTIDTIAITQGSFHLTASLQLEAGNIYAVIGPSGAGKSTLLGAISGFIPLQSGRIFWNEQDITPLPPAERPLSILFQDSNLFPHLSAFENVGLGLKPNLRLSRDQRAQVETALVQVGLHDMHGRKPAELSGGQQSRVALARALLRDKAILALDEPFAALGPALRSEMLALVAQIAAEKKLTILMVTHNPNDARQIAQSIIHVTDGMAHAPVQTREFLENPPPALRDYLGFQVEPY